MDGGWQEELGLRTPAYPRSNNSKLHSIADERIEQDKRSS